MAFFIYIKRPAQKIQRREIDRNHWLGRGIDLCFRPQGSLDIYGPTFEQYPVVYDWPGASDPFSLVQTPYGLGVQKGSADGVAAFGEKTDFQFGTEDFTLFLREKKLGAGGTYAAPIGKGDTGADEFMLQVRPANSRYLGDINAILVTLNPDNIDGRWYDFIVSRVGSTCYFYTSDLRSNSWTSASDTTASASISENNHFLTLFGADYNGTAFDTTRNCHCLLTHAYVALGVGIDEDQARSLSLNPDQVFKDKTIWVPVPVAAAGATVLVPTASLTLTPQVPSVAAGAAVSVPLATLTLSPQVPTVAAGAAVAVPLATLTLTAQVPTVAGGAAVTVPLATLTLTPQVPTVAAGAAVTVPLATLTLTPQTPVIEAGAEVNVIVPLATLTLSPQVPTVAAGAAVTVPLATLTLTPQTPVIVAGATTVTVPLATLTLTPKVPVVAAGAAITVPLATLTLTPLAPTIETAQAANVEVPLATLTLTPQVPAVAAGATVSVPLAILTLTPNAPSVGVFTEVAVPLQALTLSSAAPTVTGGATITIPGAPHFTLSPLVPVPATGARVEVPQVSFRIFPHAPISWGAPIEELPSVAIETDQDLLGLMADDNVTVIHDNVGYYGLLSEEDGETLDGGTETDGVLELQMRLADVNAGLILEGDNVLIAGVSYRIGKIDVTGGKMALLLLETTA